MDGERETRSAEPPPERTMETSPSGEPEPSEPVVPEDGRAVERRTGTDRRVTDEEVEEERRIEARRQRDRESRERRKYIVQRITLGVDYLFYLLYGLLGIRFVLSLLGAAETAGFVVFINSVTDPFYAAFSGIVARPTINGGVLDLPVVIALLAYVLLHIAVRGLLRLLAGERRAP
jgi:uncharacterized protein YggT (Ycf19 family)